VHLEETRRESHEELDAAVADAVRNHFAYRAERKRRDFQALMSRGRTSLAVGLVFYAACFLVGQLVGGLSSDSLAQLGRESLLIGGWVALGARSRSSSTTRGRCAASSAHGRDSRE